jgi:protoporphyrinogen oxidase
MDERVIIIGAGPAGISCGYELSRAGYKVIIYEASPYIGGMARSLDLWGQRVDMGPHRFFSTERKVNEFFASVVQKDFTLVNRTTRIYFNNKFFHYPIRILDALKKLPPITIFQILWHYLIIQISPIRNPATFEQWVTNKFGKKLYQLFFKHYSEKLWGIPCSRIDADWASQRIKQLNLWETIKSSVQSNSAKKHATLLDQFAYPNEGSGVIYEKAAEVIKANGGEIILKTKIQQILQNESGNITGIKLSDGSIIYSDYIVSSMPLTDLIRSLSVPQDVIAASKKLYFRNTILVYLEIDSTNLFSDNWIYVHSPEVNHGRITNFRNWSKGITRGKMSSILCMEFWAFDHDSIWTESDDRIIQIAKKEIDTLNLLPKESTILNSHVLKIHNSYPVYETGYKEHIKIIEDFLGGIKNLIPIGRNGTFKYNNQDHSILMGLLASEIILLKKDIDLWKVNTDSNYQESEKIQDILKN